MTDAERIGELEEALRRTLSPLCNAENHLRIKPVATLIAQACRDAYDNAVRVLYRKEPPT